VYAFTCDLRNEGLWDAEVHHVACEGAVVTGRGYGATFRPFLAESDGTLTVVEAVPGKRVVLESVFAGLTSRITYHLEEEGHGTRFTRNVTVTPTGMLRVVSPLVARRARRCNRRDVAQLKRVLEAG
jgi:hypothetical protein